MDSFIQKTLSFVAYVTKWGALIARQVRTADIVGFCDALARFWKRIVQLKGWNLVLIVAIFSFMIGTEASAWVALCLTLPLFTGDKSMKNQQKPVKIFYSYSHEDASDKNVLDEYLKLFAENHKIEIKDDRDIYVGEWENKINDMISESDIVLCFISNDYFASKHCKQELNSAYEQQKTIVPIILSNCSWKNFKFNDGKPLSKLHAHPKSADKNNLIPISNWKKKDKAWQGVYEKVSLIIKDEQAIKNCQLKDDFEEILNDCEELNMLNKNKLSLDNIFVWPKFDRSYQEDTDEDVQEKELFNDIDGLGKIWIIGEDRAGKTALAKKIFKDLKEKGFVPVLFLGRYEGKLENQLARMISEQYIDLKINLNDNRDKIIPIIDDFHRSSASIQNKLIEQLNRYTKHVLITDMVFSFDLPNKNLSDVETHYCRYKINRFYSVKRNELIRKWLTNDIEKSRNDFYKELDERTNLINSAIGTILNHGIVPWYPFFLIAIIDSYESKKINFDITSQGHCYYALIYLNFRKHGLSPKDDDEYLNFLYTLAYHFYKDGIYKISKSDLEHFIEDVYRKEYTLSIKTDTLIQKLKTMELLHKDSLGFYQFHYKYYYFYFVAKYIADNLNSDPRVKKDIENIFDNLHTDANAYIAIFIAHHTKDDFILDNIWLHANILFEQYKPVTLDKQESSFIDSKIKEIADIALPNKNKPDTARQEMLEQQEEQEKISSVESRDYENDEEENQNALIIDIRKCMRTAEVMGQIIRNRSGSLRTEKIVQIFTDAMNLYLRLLGFIFEMLKEEGNAIEKHVANQLQEEAKNYKQDLSKDKAEEIAKKILSAMIYNNILGCLERIVLSLGSEKLSDVISETCNRINTPISILVKIGISMQYKKSLDVDEIKKETDGFSLSPTKIRNVMIASYCYFHNIEIEDRQKISDTLKISVIPSNLRKKDRRE